MGLRSGNGTHTHYAVTFIRTTLMILESWLLMHDGPSSPIRAKLGQEENLIGPWLVDCQSHVLYRCWLEWKPSRRWAAGKIGGHTVWSFKILYLILGSDIFWEVKSMVDNREQMATKRNRLATKQIPLVSKLPYEERLHHPSPSLWSESSRPVIHYTKTQNSTKGKLLGTT